MLTALPCPKCGEAGQVEFDGKGYYCNNCSAIWTTKKGKP